jgi:hypothetical protein
MKKLDWRIDKAERKQKKRNNEKKNGKQQGWKLQINRVNQRYQNLVVSNW